MDNKIIPAPWFKNYKLALYDDRYLWRYPLVLELNKHNMGTLDPYSSDAINFTGLLGVEQGYKRLLEEEVDGVVLLLRPKHMGNSYINEEHVRIVLENWRKSAIIYAPGVPIEKKRGITVINNLEKLPFTCAKIADYHRRNSK